MFVSRREKKYAPTQSHLAVNIIEMDLDYRSSPKNIT